MENQVRCKMVWICDCNNCVNSIVSYFYKGQCSNMWLVTWSKHFMWDSTTKRNNVKIMSVELRDHLSDFTKLPKACTGSSFLRSYHHILNMTHTSKYLIWHLHNVDHVLYKKLSEFWCIVRHSYMMHFTHTTHYMWPIQQSFIMQRSSISSSVKLL